MEYTRTVLSLFYYIKTFYDFLCAVINFCQEIKTDGRFWHSSAYFDEIDFLHVQTIHKRQRPHMKFSINVIII